MGATVTIALWDWLEDLNFLVGADFPEADEDALRRCGLAWADAAADLRSLGMDAVRAGDAVGAALGGAAGESFAEMWRPFAGRDEGYFGQLATLYDQLAAACEQTALDVEYAKLEYIGALVALAGTLAALASCLWFFGLSALGVPGAISGAQFTVRLILTRLVTGILAGTVFNVGLDVGAQAVQFLDGHRDEWDGPLTLAAARDGAMYGGIGGGVFLGAGRLMSPSLGRLRAGLGLFGAAGTTGAVGSIVVPIVDGRAPTVDGFVEATLSGTFAGLGALHGRPGEHAVEPDLSDIEALGPVSGARIAHASIDADAVQADVAPPTGRLVLDGDRLPTAEVASGAGPGAAFAGHDRADDVGEPGGGDQSTGTATAQARPQPESRRVDVGAAGIVGAVPAPLGHLASAVSHDRPAEPSGRGQSRSALDSSSGPGAFASGESRRSAAGARVPADASIAEARADPPGEAARTDSQSADPVRATVTFGVPARHDALSVSGNDLAPWHTTEPSARPAALPSPAADALSDRGWAARGAEDLRPRWEDPKSGRFLTGRENLAVEQLLDRARAAEPEITPLVRTVAAEVDGEFVEVNHLKERDSLKSKIARQLRRGINAAPLADALAGVKDAVRYTILLPEDGYARQARAAIASMLDRGLRPVAERRSWGGESGYCGLNTVWLHETTGQVFEVQLHTSDSFAAKTVTHPLYGAIRDLDAGPEQAALKLEHDAYFVDVAVPDGAVDVGLPTSVARHVPVPAEPDVPRSRSATSPLWCDPRRPVTDAEALALVRQHVVGTDAGLAFYRVDDEMREFAGAVRPAEGYVTLDLHGSPAGFQIEHGLLTPHQFAAALRDLRDAGLLRLPEGVGIKLISCDTAFGAETSPAAVLASELGVEVIAPDQPVWTSVDGYEIVSSPTLDGGVLLPTMPPDGHWLRFGADGQRLASDPVGRPASRRRPYERTPGQVPSGPGPPRPDGPGWPGSGLRMRGLAPHVDVVLAPHGLGWPPAGVAPGGQPGVLPAPAPSPQAGVGPGQ